jgi:hypothetical protein
MALVVVNDPYEWVDPEKGRQGILVHTSQFGEFIPRVEPLPVITWNDVWEKYDGNKE